MIIYPIYEFIKPNSWWYFRYRDEYVEQSRVVHAHTHLVRPSFNNFLSNFPLCGMKLRSTFLLVVYSVKRRVLLCIISNEVLIEFGKNFFINRISNNSVTIKRYCLWKRIWRKQLSHFRPFHMKSSIYFSLVELVPKLNMV